MLAVLFANGDYQKSAKDEEILAQADLVIAADGGAAHCQKLNIVPDYLLGDLDSIAPDLLEEFQAKDVTTQKYPPAKDATDLELCLDFVVTLKAARVHIFGALGGRWDMSLANLLLLANPRFSKMNVTLSGVGFFIQALWPGSTILSSTPGQRVSLLALGEDASEVTLTGFEYPLANQTIPFATSLGVSNRVKEDRAEISLGSGMLLCVFC
jgi:thiamine pyrophosphokinase